MAGKRYSKEPEKRKLQRDLKARPLTLGSLSLQSLIKVLIAINAVSGFYSA